MFNFTTTTFINSDKYLDGTPRWVVKDGRFEVRHNSIVLKKEDVELAGGCVYKKEGTPGKKAVATIDLSSCSDDTKTYRLALYIRLMMVDQDSYYSNDLVFKGKPFYVEFVGGDTCAEDLVDLIKRYELLMYEKPVVEVEGTGTSLTLTAVKPTQIFTKIEVQEQVERTLATAVTPGAKVEFVTMKDVKPEIEPGYEDFGTYHQLLKDVSLPTYEHRHFGTNQVDEQPIPGVLYNQYIVRMAVRRGVMGGAAVGQLATSLTTHVFWVPQTLSDQFEADLLAGTGVSEVTPVDVKTDAPTSGDEDTVITEPEP